ncbi:MAG: FmdB family transcriptional regulator [Actinomycetota bacterium]|nr:MAG: FmdB family transcriptional regulator [Actinomycetota bacterium]
MPTYEYVCNACQERLEVVQSFSDDALTVCPACGGPLRKLFGNVGVVFKGSGFYRNDSRAADGKKKATTSASTSSDSAGSGTSSTAAAATPAASGSTTNSGSSSSSTSSKDSAA